ncbi:MAG: thiamine pyrophosphate-binding protein [Vicinamibacterales bacterium]|nr:thiamine pyrophosphate-binding protein [Vicinamibacterales bacterium]
MHIRGSALVVQALEDAGARFAFGIPGTHNIELYDALAQSGQVSAILVTDEQSAGFMADGVSRSSSTVGVVNLVPGAGVTHALSGIAEALLDGIPMVVLACGVRRDTSRAYQLHDLDQAALLRPVTKAVLTPASPGDLYGAVRQAFALAQRGTPGPVAVEVPADFYLLTHDVADPREPAPASPVPPPDRAAVAAAAALLRSASRPVIYVGYGARHAGDRLVALAERLGAPVATTIQGKGVFPERHPLWVWNGFGRSAPSFAREIGDTCDAMLAIGCRFSEVGTGSWGFAPPPALIHTDINPEVFGRNFPARIAIEADAAAFVDALLEALGASREWGDRTEHIAVGHAAVRETWRRTRSDDRVTPAWLFDALQRLTRDAIFTTDSGNGTFLAMEHLRLDRPGRFLAPVDYSCMGYAVPAAIGAKLANPERDVVALAGDGALLMTGLETLTAASYEAAPVICVLRDGELAQIAQFQRTALARASNSVLPPYSVEGLADAVTAAYLLCTKDAHVESVLTDALAISRTGRPVFVEVAIDYAHKTYFTKGVVATNFWRLPAIERLRMLGRAVGRHVQRRLEPDW